MFCWSFILTLLKELRWITDDSVRGLILGTPSNSFSGMPLAVIVPSQLLTQWYPQCQSINAAEDGTTLRLDSFPSFPSCGCSWGIRAFLLLSVLLYWVGTEPDTLGNVRCSTQNYISFCLFVPHPV